MNQLIFTDAGVIIGLDPPLTQDLTRQVAESVTSWLDGTHKVLILPVADWDVIDRRTVASEAQRLFDRTRLPMSGEKL